MKLTLRFLASNGFYRLIGHAQGVHKSTVCRAIKRTKLLVEQYFDSLVKWPDNLNERINIGKEFFVNGGFPNVCGAIDGTRRHNEAKRR